MKEKRYFIISVFFFTPCHAVCSDAQNGSNRVCEFCVWSILTTDPVFLHAHTGKTSPEQEPTHSAHADVGLCVQTSVVYMQI